MPGPDIKRLLPMLATAAGNGADMLSTQHAIDSGAGQEGNPLLPKSPWAIDGVKGAATVGELGLEHWLQTHGHEKLALGLGLGIGGLGAGMAAHNMGVGRRKP